MNTPKIKPKGIKLLRFIFSPQLASVVGLCSILFQPQNPLSCCRAFLYLFVRYEPKEKKFPELFPLAVPTEAVAADTGRKIVVSGVSSALVFLDDVIYFPCAHFRLALLHATSRKNQRIAAEVAVAGGAGEDEFKSGGCH